LLAALFVTNGFWIYKTIDNAVTLHYANDSANFSARTLQAAIRVANLNAIGMSADEVMHLIQPDENVAKPFEKEGCIYTGLICLILDSDRIVVGVE